MQHTLHTGNLPEFGRLGCWTKHGGPTGGINCRITSVHAFQFETPGCT